MADRKITELSLADSTDITSSNAVLHLVNPDRALDVDKNRKALVSDVVDYVVSQVPVPTDVVLLTGDQTIGGTKTFSNTIVGDISGTAGNANTLNGIDSDGFLSSSGDTSTGMLTVYTSMSSQDDYFNSPISIRERDAAGSGDGEDRDSPNLNFHWSGRVSNSLWMGSNGWLNWGSYSSTGIPASDGAFRTGSLISNGNTTVNGDLYGRSVNGQYSRLYRWGGIYFTWDSDSYGTNFEHSITSTDNGAWGDDITINSYGNVRVNIDSNGNGTNTFSIGRHTTGTANTLFTLDESGNTTITGNLYIPSYMRHNGDTDNYMGFNTTDSQVFVTGNTTRLTINNTAIYAARNLDMNNYDIVGADQIVHEGDTNTYIQFHASDQWRVVTGGTERLEVNNTRTTMQNAQVTGTLIIPVV